MSELAHVGVGIKTSFTPEWYAERKAYWLANVDKANEYVVMGKIFCRHCKSEKSLDMPERNFYTKCACDCVRRRVDEEERRKERMEKARSYRERNESAIPTEVQGARFLGIVTPSSREGYITICERCENFCRNFQAVKKSGRGIWLYGGFDTGKTYLATAMLRELQKDGVLTVFTTMERIFEEVKGTYNATSVKTTQAVMTEYAFAECLIIDNFSGIKAVRKGMKNWEAEVFSELVTRRYDRHLPTVVTSRKSIKELATEGLIPNELVDKLVSKMVAFPLTENQRRVSQQAIEF